MDENTLKALTALAEKLGTTSEYLWGVLLKQAPISGVIDLAIMAMWVALAFAWFRFVLRKTTTESSENMYPDWSDDGAVFLAWASVIVMVVIAAAVIGENLSIAVSALLNPEYWALKQILN